MGHHLPIVALCPHSATGGADMALTPSSSPSPALYGAPPPPLAPLY